MKIDLTFNFKNKDDTDVVDGNAAKVISNYLYHSQSDNPIKSRGWAKKLDEDGILELDKADLITFKNRIDKMPLADGLKGDLLERIIALIETQ